MKTLTLTLMGVLAAVAAEDVDDLFTHVDARVPFTSTIVGKAVDRISYKFIKEAVAENENFISSPLGLLVLLSQYSEGVTAGGLKGALLGYISNENNTEVPKTYTELSDRLSSLDPSFFVLANKIYLAEGAKLQESFSTTASKYHSDVGNIDFTKKKIAADTINKWVSDKTKETIKNAVSEDTLSEDMIAALLNVIYFQGHWHVPFSTENTEQRDFHVSKTEVVKKPSMHLEQPLYYYESSSLEARLIELPYKEKNFRMIVVLPNDVDGLSSVLDKVATHGLLNDIVSLHPSIVKVDLQLPKFEIDTFLDLKNVLEKLGLKSLFIEPATNILKGINVTVSKAIQKAFVKVDEEGATAGAFTGIFMVPMSLNSGPPQKIEFHVDRPFLFAIYYEEIPLFLGTYVK